jgi:hypothetical protein
MTTRETLVKELEQLNTAIDFNSKQGLKLLSEYANVVTFVANKEMIFFEDDQARLLRRARRYPQILRSDPRLATAGTSEAGTKLSARRQLLELAQIHFAYAAQTDR